MCVPDKSCELFSDADDLIENCESIKRLEDFQSKLNTLSNKVTDKLNNLKGN